MTCWPSDSGSNNNEKEKEEEEEEESLSIWLWATCRIYMSLPVAVHVCVPNEASSAGKAAQEVGPIFGHITHTPGRR